MALALLADVVYSDNIRMRKASGGLGFLFKAGKGLLVKAFALNDFNGYGAAEPGVLSLEDNTPAALSQLLCDLVPAALERFKHRSSPATVGRSSCLNLEQSLHDLYNHTRG